MIDISVVNVVKSFQLNKNILDGLSFDVNSGERVGILGKNGAGKTTLFKIITGQIECDEGDVVIAAGKRAGLISQIPVFPAHYLVEDVLLDAFERQRKLKEKMEELESMMNAGDQSEATLKRYGEMSARFEQLEGYDIQVQLNKVCNGLGIPQQMRQRLFSTLSGGEMTRINLARLLLEKTDILLLDEPTNHLDIAGVEWLEEYLKSFKGTVLTVSHDRYFLDSVVNRIVEIEDGKCEIYKGNYSQYSEQKKHRLEELERRYEKEQAKVKQLQFAAERMHGWAIQNEKLMKRAQAMEKRIERIQTVDKPKKESTMRASFKSAEFRGDEALVIKGVSKSYSDKILFSELDLLVKGGERIALIGDNGAGKTTLIRLIMGLEDPDKGRIYLGPTIKPAYLPQKVTFANQSLTLVDTVIDALGCTAQTARNRLGAYKFSGEDAFKCVSELSGGEKSRLALCILMDADVNLLILDEPTNHLDVPSRNWIESAVEGYEGALIFVSHDRYFINNFAERVWSLENGNIADIQGGYQAYLEHKKKSESMPAVKPVQVKPKNEKPKRPKDNRRILRQRIGALEKEISQAEALLEQLEKDIQENSGDYLKLGELLKTQEETQALLEEKLGCWEALSIELEEADG